MTSASMMDVPPAASRDSRSRFVSATEQSRSSRVKRCRKCDDSKPLSEFPVRTDSPDGRRNECLKCHADGESVRRERNRVLKMANGVRRLAACDSLEAMQKTVNDHFGGDWCWAMRQIWQICLDGSDHVRLDALEATQRITILAIAERERVAHHNADCQEFAEALIELPPSAIVELIRPETCRALREHLEGI